MYISNTNNFQMFFQSKLTLPQNSSSQNLSILIASYTRRQIFNFSIFFSDRRKKIQVIQLMMEMDMIRQ